MAAFGTIPGGVYTLLEKFVLRSNTAVMGARTRCMGIPPPFSRSNEDTKDKSLLQVPSPPISRPQPLTPSSVGPYKIPTWTTPLILIVITSILVPYVSLVGHLCGAGLGYLWATGYIKFLVPHEKILRWIETKLNLLGRLPHYVSVDQKTYGRYGVLPTTGIPLGPRSPDVGQRLGP
ncbi:hypothetical protein GGP41_008855 [Bipolaris sorokiniana]|uniref:Peptidase S54 rhomboid domain-containing protein n=1 Tax=Cochliobolus sativus TaxID=45130 RepID=A0A8H5Z8U0_COCSA|nr:hypothetical protein GGP41_008855 [Bipolaris sorokiniana]